MKAVSRYVSGLAAGEQRASRALVQTIVYKATADVASKAVTLAITVVAARVFSSAQFGVLALAMTTGWLLGVASDAGLSLYLARRLAQGAGGRPSGFGPVAEVMSRRMWFAAVAALAGIGIGPLVVPREAWLAFWLIVAAQLLNATLETLAHAYRGLGRTNIESSVTITQRLVTAGAAIAVLAAAPSLQLLAVALVIPPAVALFASYAIARRVSASAASTGVSAPAATEPAPQRLSSFAPVGLGILISALYFRCDVYFVEHWHGLETVGTYNAAFRIVEALRLFPAAVLAVVFPTLCRASGLAPLKRLTAALLAAAALLSAIVYFSAPSLLEIVYGTRFVQAAPAFRVLSLTLPLFFANYALTHQVIAWDGQRTYLVIASTALVANLAGNMVLIPGGGMVGAAVSTLLTEVVVAAGCLLALGTATTPVERHGAVAEVGDFAGSVRGVTQ